MLVIGIDGASWNAIDPMLARGELPGLAALIARGGSAELATVEPVTSPVVWTSIATGRSPGVHGVSGFFATRAQIHVPTLYERLAASGRRVGLYDVLMTWPPASLPGGFVVPGWLRRDDSTWPPDALDVEAAVFRTVYQAKPSDRDYLEQARREIAEKPRSWRALVRRFDPEVGVLTFYGVDATSHRYWHASFPGDFPGQAPPHAEDEAFAVQETLRGVDRAVGEIVGELSPEDAVLVVSDHGFQARQEVGDIWVTRFEEQLAKADLDPARDGFTLVGTFSAVALRIAPGPFEDRDRTIDALRELLDSYRTLEGEPLMRVQVFDVARRPKGMRRPLRRRLGQWLARTTMRLFYDMDLDESAHALIFAQPLADRLLPLWPDGRVRVQGDTVPLRHAIYRQRFTGGHHPTAVFIAAGGPIARRTQRGELSVLDVAPLVAYLAGSPIPDDLEGRLPDEWVRAGHRAAHPPVPVPAAELPGLREVPRALGDVRDPELVEKLRALGYLE